jgi:hypothetical protein
MRILTRRTVTELMLARRATAATEGRRPESPPGIHPAPRLAAAG